MQDNRITTCSRYPNRKTADYVRVVKGSKKDLKKERILLLVHGFNNSEDRAHAYFREFQERLAAEGFDPDSWGAVWEFYWPGDEGGGKLMNLVAYPEKVPVAPQAALQLYIFLNDCMRKRQQIYIVAHSLGCRVVLETLLAIRERPHYRGPKVLGVALLAAAVRVSDCRPGGPFQPLSRLRREAVYFSRSDKALRPLAFGVGQLLAGEKGKAVGREGKPDDRWKPDEDLGLDHGEYWGSPEVAARVSRLLGAGPEPLPQLPVPFRKLDVAEPPDSRQLSHRTVTGADDLTAWS